LDSGGGVSGIERSLTEKKRKGRKGEGEESLLQSLFTYVRKKKNLRTDRGEASGEKGKKEGKETYTSKSTCARVEKKRDKTSSARRNREKGREEDGGTNPCKKLTEKGWGRRKWSGHWI